MSDDEEKPLGNKPENRRDEGKALQEAARQREREAAERARREAEERARRDRRNDDG